MEIVVWCFMLLAAGCDLIKKKIPGWMFWIFGTAGVVRCVAEAARCLMSGNQSGGISADCGGVLAVCGNILEAFGKVFQVVGKNVESIMVGVGLLLLCGVTEGAVGEGDGWFFCVTGLYISWKYNLALLCYGLLLCSAYGMILIIWGRLKGISVRKRKMPFLPFVCLAGFLMRAGHM